jgi:peptide-methionine (S)-S-oxide reductase
MNNQKAYFAAGCFWGVEEQFAQIPGVIDTKVGYAGGTKENPTYQDVLGHQTGHAESIEVTFDPTKTSYEKLLEVFWRIHNPTTANRQGPDVGNNYRSAVFYVDDSQKKVAEKSKKVLGLAKKYDRPIVTEISPLGKFWPAEEYHQKYFLKHSNHVC